jgi:hypothetical protein
MSNMSNPLVRTSPATRLQQRGLLPYVCLPRFDLLTAPLRLYQTSVGDEYRKIERPASPMADVDYTEVRAEPFQTFHPGAHAGILTLAFLGLRSGGDLVDWYGVFLTVHHLASECNRRTSEDLTQQNLPSVVQS